MRHRVPQLLEDCRIHGSTLWLHRCAERTHCRHAGRRTHPAEQALEPPPIYQVQRHQLHHPASGGSHLHTGGTAADKGNDMDNARTMKQGLEAAGLKVYGGVNAPYIWLKTPDGTSSWRFFEQMLYEANVVGTPGVGFGPSGEGYIRLTAFGKHEDCVEAMKRIRKWLK